MYDVPYLKDLAFDRGRPLVVCSYRTATSEGVNAAKMKLNEGEKIVGQATVPLGRGRPKDGDKPARSPIYRCGPLAESSTG